MSGSVGISGWIPGILYDPVRDLDAGGVEAGVDLCSMTSPCGIVGISSTQHEIRGDGARMVLRTALVTAVLESVLATTNRAFSLGSQAIECDVVTGPE